MAKGETSPSKKDESKEECAWCKYMKGGGCREPFEAWQSCVDAVMGDNMDDEARRTAVDNCSSVTKPLFECMMRHRDYYGAALEGMGGGGGNDLSAAEPSTSTANATNSSGGSRSSGGSSSTADAASAAASGGPGSGGSSSKGASSTINVAVSAGASGTTAAAAAPS